MNEVELDIYSSSTESELPLPYSSSGIAAGFPSPAENYLEQPLDLNKLVIRNPSSTFFANVKGLSMVDDGINDGDLLVIDKSIHPYNGCIAVCFVDGEFTLKRFKKENNHAWLIPANKEFKPIRVDDRNDFMIWGVVTYVIKKM